MFIRIMLQRDFAKQLFSLEAGSEQELLGVILTLSNLLNETSPESGLHAWVETIECYPDHQENEK
jgi:hypothetical protein